MKKPSIKVLKHGRNGTFLGGNAVMVVEIEGMGTHLVLRQAILDIWAGEHRERMTDAEANAMDQELNILWAQAQEKAAS